MYKIQVIASPCPTEAEQYKQYRPNYKFTIYYQVRFLLTSNAGCNGEMTIAGTELTSPDYPSNYPNNKDCVHVIKFKKGEKITLKFMEFSIAGWGSCS